MASSSNIASSLPNPTDRFVEVLDGGAAAVCGSNCGSDEDVVVPDVALSAEF
jgi:hypothetical protein